MKQKAQISHTESEWGDTNAMKDWSGCSSEAARVVQLESKWVPLKAQD